MKIAKKTASLLFALVMVVSMLTVGASAGGTCKSSDIKGNGSEAYEFYVTTNSKKSPYIKLTQTKGTAPYKTLATLIKDEDMTKDAKLYGQYYVTVYNEDGTKNTEYSCLWDVKGWNDGSTKKISLGKNSTYKIKIDPSSVEDVFAAYINKGLFHLNALRYGMEAAHYDGTWTTAPQWSVKDDNGIKSYSYA